MFGKRFTRAMAATTAGSLILAAGAFAADGVINDQDFATPGNQNTIAAGAQTRGTQFSVEGTLRIEYAGNQAHLAPGSTVVLELNTAQSSAGVAADDLSFTIPTTWTTNSVVDATTTSTIAYTPGAGEADGAHTLTAAFKCKSGCIDTGPGNTQTLNTANARVFVSYSLSTSTPTNTAPVIAWASGGNPSSADEGDTKTYNFAITDPDANTWSFVSSYPNCGSGGALVAGSAIINQGAKTGTFQCSFPDGPASGTVSVKVNDGSADSNELTQAVTVANVKPTPTIDSLSGNGGTACIAGNTVTLGFSWTDPAGTNDVYNYSVSWGDGSSATTASNASSPVSNVQHTYAAGGPYAIQVTANDEDAGAGNSTSSSLFSFLYNVTGVLQPVNDTQAKNDPSIFKFGSTIPVKIRVTDCDQYTVTGLSPRISIQKMSGSTPSGTDETVASTSAADTGNVMRYSDGLYIYNLATKSLADSSATYQLKITGPFADVITLFGTKAK